MAIYDIQTLDKVQGVLKDKYMGAFDNLLTTEPDPFIEEIEKTECTNNVIKAACPFGINGSVGFGTDGSKTPISGRQLYEDFKVSAVNFYANLEISDKTVKLAQKDVSSMIDVVHGEITSAYEAAKWNLGRAAYSDGTGILTKVTAASGKSVTVESVKFLKEGMIIDVLTSAGEVKNTVRILAIDRRNNVFKSDKDVSYASGDFITLQNSYMKELTGLGAIFNDDIDEIFGKKKSENIWLKPTVIELDDNENLTDIVLTDAMSQVADYSNSNIDMIMMGRKAFNAYQNYMKESNVTITEKLHFKGGHTGFDVLLGDRTAKVVCNNFVPDEEVWGINTKAWKYERTKFDFVSYNSSIFTLVPDYNYYRALMASYGNLICSNPGGHFRITNCALKTETV